MAILWRPFLFVATERGSGRKCQYIFYSVRPSLQFGLKQLHLIAMQFKNKSYPSISMWGVSLNMKKENDYHWFLAKIGLAFNQL